MGDAVFKFSVGRAGGSAENVRYIVRGLATGEDIGALRVLNYDHYVTDTTDYTDLRRRLIEAVRQDEEVELARAVPGRGQARTHYRGICTVQGKVPTDDLLDLAEQWVRSNFPNVRTIIALHSNTANSHCHVHLQARDESTDRKIQLTTVTYRNLDSAWAKIIGGAYGMDRYDEHEAKKIETRAWKRALVLARTEGREPPPRPQREPRHLNRAEYLEREARAHGIEATVGGVERGVADGTTGAARGERARERAAREHERAATQIDRAESAARAALDQAGRAVRAPRAVERERETTERQIASRYRDGLIDRDIERG